MSADLSTSRQVTFISNDGEKYEVPIEVARMSDLARDLVDGVYCSLLF